MAESCTHTRGDVSYFDGCNVGKITLGDVSSHLVTDPD